MKAKLLMVMIFVLSFSELGAASTCNVTATDFAQGIYAFSSMIAPQEGDAIELDLQNLNGLRGVLKFSSEAYVPLPGGLALKESTVDSTKQRYFAGGWSLFGIYLEINLTLLRISSGTQVSIVGLTTIEDAGAKLTDRLVMICK